MKNKKKICFRFDVDTHVCLSKGMPKLLSLAEQEGVVFTFFVNMGKGFDRVNSIKNILGRLLKRRSDSKQHSDSLSMFSKLGRKESLIATFMNPFVGAKYTDILRQAVKAGHELGLHGGKNHSHWEKQALSWGYEKLASEIDFGLRHFERAGLPRPLSFASPAWQSPLELQQVLKDKGFTVCADVRDAKADSVETVNELHQIPTNILSDSDDVGFIENYRAIGLGYDEILSAFTEQLKLKQSLAMVYEHPFYAGVHEIELLRAMIKSAKKEEFTLTTVNNIMDCVK